MSITSRDLDRFAAENYANCDRPAYYRYINEARHHPCRRSPEHRALEEAMRLEAGPEPLHKRIRWFVHRHLSDFGPWLPSTIEHLWGRLRRGWGVGDLGGLDTHIASIIVGAGRFYLTESFAQPHPKLAELVEGMEHYADECDHRCPKVQRALELLPEVFPSLWQ